MINPILLIAAAAVLLSAVVVAVLNKPRFPLIAATIIMILIFFVVSTYLLDRAIGSYSSEGLSTVLNFLVIGSDMSVAKLEEVFTSYEIIDIGLFAASLVSMFLEALYILRKNSDV